MIQNFDDYNKYINSHIELGAEDFKSELQNFCDDHLAYLYDKVNGRVRIDVTASTATIIFESYERISYQDYENYFTPFYDFLNENYNITKRLKIMGDIIPMGKYNRDFYHNELNSLEFKNAFSKNKINGICIPMNTRMVRQVFFNGPYDFIGLKK